MRILFVIGSGLAGSVIGALIAVAGTALVVISSEDPYALFSIFLMAIDVPIGGALGVSLALRRRGGAPNRYAYGAAIPLFPDRRARITALAGSLGLMALVVAGSDNVAFFLGLTALAISLGTGAWLLLIAFHESDRAGALLLIVPFYHFYYLFSRWHDLETKRAGALHLACLLAIQAILVVGSVSSPAEVFPAPETV